MLCKRAKHVLLKEGIVLNHLVCDCVSKPASKQQNQEGSNYQLLQVTDSRKG